MTEMPWNRREIHRKSDQTPPDMKLEDCIHPGLGQNKASELLSAAKQDGSFLIRESETIKGAYTLCLLACGTVYQYRIIPGVDGKVTIKCKDGLQSNKYSSVTQLVSDYMKRGRENGLAGPLVNPVFVRTKKDTDHGDDSGRPTVCDQNSTDLEIDYGKQFKVHINSSSVPKRCGVNDGIYKLVLFQQHASLVEPTTGIVSITWQYRFIRRYGYNDSTFLLDGGQNCGLGEGVFVFENCRGNEIIKEIEILRENILKRRDKHLYCHRKPVIDNHIYSKIRQPATPDHNVVVPSDKISLTMGHKLYDTSLSSPGVPVSQKKTSDVDDSHKLIPVFGELFLEDDDKECLEQVGSFHIYDYYLLPEHHFSNSRPTSSVESPLNGT